MLLGASILINIILVLFIRECVKEIGEEVEKKEQMCVDFNLLLEKIEENYRVNGIEHRLFNDIQYRRVKRHFEEHEI